MIYNSDFKRFLLESCRNSNYITLIDNTSYGKITNNEDEVLVEIQDNNRRNNKSTTVNTELLLVCDSRYSKAREQFFSDRIYKDYRQTALTFLVTHEKKHEGTAVEHFLSEGPFAILPMKDDNISSIVWSVSPEYSEVIQKLPTDELEFLVSENFGPFLGKVKVIEGDSNPIASFPLRCIVADLYYNKRIALIADTAHIVHPLAGQGLNLGIKDMESLVKNIKKLGLTKEALQKYYLERKGDNQNMAEITDVLNAIFSNDSRALGSARRIGLNFIEKAPALKKILMGYAMGKR
jgi:2-octaprenyl-6-methoxyphenol hydroxylase